MSAAYSIARSPPGGEARQASLLVVEDDPAMRRMILDYFNENNMRAVAAGDRQEMLARLKSAEVDLVVLDLKLGSTDGLDLLREIRSGSDLPVIIVTGHRRDEIDRIVGLELGADDYLTKPFNPRDLLARVKAVLRRHDAQRPVPTRATNWRFAGWRLDERARTLTNPAGEPVALTKGEYGLLLAFVEAPRRTLSREFLMQATRLHEDVYDRSIDVQILRLRRKIERDANAPKLIQTRRGVGYVFDIDVERV